MQIFEISMKVFLMRDIDSTDSLFKIGQFIDNGICQDKQLLELHNKNKFKNYCFCSFYPLEKDRVYKKNNNYTIKIRTVDKNLAEYFNEKLVNHFNNDIKGLTSTIKILPKKYIEKIYSITPAVLKTNEGYWRGNFSVDDFEKRTKDNLIKKYNSLMNTKIDENFDLCTAIKFDNKKPVSVNYKGKKMLGDKVSIQISDNKMAQNLAYMSLGTGILEMNARGLGYMNFKWI